MADDQVKYSDLIADDVVKGLEVLNQALQDIKTTMAGVKSEAASLGIAIKSVSTATREQQQATAQNAANVERLSKKMKDLSEEERKVEEIKRRYKKLTDEQIQAVNAFQQALRGNTASILAAVNAIDVENKSYNELNAMYNTLKDSLNAMTVAERQNTEAGKAMTAQSAKIYDTMNELQKATGKYTLQVGKYRAAFDGLGYSFQQILREAPSALNLNQFFLAISNNIPMFLDQLKAFKDEQKAIQENLKGMTKGTTEYEEQLSKVESVGQKLGRTLLSWQTGVLALIMIVRKIDWAKLWANIKKVFTGVKEVKNEMSATVAMAKLMAEVTKKVADEATELDLVVERLREVKKGSEEWQAGIKTVNKITKENLGTTTATLKEVEKITEAYKKQAEQVAKNQILADMIAKSEANKIIRQSAYEANDLGGLSMLLDIKADTKDYKNLKELYDEYAKLKEQYQYFSTNPDATLTRTIGTTSTGQVISQTLTASEALKSIEQSYTNATTALDNFINNRLPILSKEAQEKLRAQFELINPLKTGKNGRTYSLKDVDFLESEQLDKDAVIELESSFKQKLAMLEEQRQKELLILKEKYDKEKKDLEFNKKHNLITEEEYNAQLLKLDTNYNNLIKTNYEGNFEEMGVIQRKYWNKRNELAAKEAERQEREEEKKNAAALKEVKDEEKNFKTFQEIEKRKFELTKHTATEEKKFVMEQQMELLQWRIDHAEALGISPELLEVMKAEYEQMKKMYDLGKYSNGKQNIQGNYTSISQILWPDLDSDQTSALNSVFDQAKEALNGWMQAKVDAANQSKELADDEVAAAENALNREIELRNQGYANDVALRERELADAKKRQQQAAELQQKAKKDQLAVNTAMEASSMAVAVANLFKDFPLYAAIPLTAVLLGAFAAAKVQSFQAINSTKYREGGVMLLEGGSHQSGHDVNLGIGPDGSNLRAEGGEYFAVINKRNSRRYGSEIPNIVNALNSGMFEDRYIKTSDAMGMLPRVIKADDGSTVDLSAVESGVGALVKQGERTWSTEGEYRVMRYKNLVRRVRVG